jgi:hypothetical protein
VLLVVVVAADRVGGGDDAGRIPSSGGGGGAGSSIAMNGQNTIFSSAPYFSTSSTLYFSALNYGAGGATKENVNVQGMQGCVFITWEDGIVPTYNLGLHSKTYFYDDA